MTDAREIAGGLNEAQRRAVLSLSGGWAARVVRGTGAYRKLYARGMAEWDRRREHPHIIHRLTPLGLAVRAILEEPTP